MPLKRARKGSSKRTRAKIASANIREMHHGATFARTARKFGKAKAHKQAIAAGLAAMRRRGKRKRK
jgi:hypothetical protein